MSEQFADEIRDAYSLIQQQIDMIEKLETEVYNVYCLQRCARVEELKVAEAEKNQALIKEIREKDEEEYQLLQSTVDSLRKLSSEMTAFLKADKFVKGTFLDLSKKFLHLLNEITDYLDANTEEIAPEDEADFQKFCDALDTEEREAERNAN